MTDPFTSADPLYRNAQRTNNATGEAISWTEGPSLRPHFLIAVAAVVIIGLALIASIH